MYLVASGKPALRLAAAAFALAAAVVAMPCPGRADPTPAEAFVARLEPWLNLRYRYEWVDAANFAERARASTVRTRAGVATPPWEGLQLLFEIENTSALGAERYDDGTGGPSRYPVVADPESTEINQANLRYLTPFATEIVAGRRRISLDNERFVGTSDFRQNQQTFDGVTLVARPAPPLELRYDFVSGVQRSFGSDARNGSWNTAIHLAHTAFRGLPGATVAAYSYWLDIDDDAALSARILGARLDGAWRLAADARLLLALDYARYADHADNPRAFALDYALIEPGVRWRGLDLAVGVERLGGNGTVAVQTPLATLHAFQGFADVFVTTPDDGVLDRYVRADWKIPRLFGLDSLRLWGAWHDFRADRGERAFGRETDLAIAAAFGSRYTVTLKAAAYRADGFAADVDKLWLSFEADF